MIFLLNNFDLLYIHRASFNPIDVSISKERISYSMLSRSRNSCRFRTLKVYHASDV